MTAEARGRGATSAGGITALTDRPLHLGEGARFVDGRLVLVDLLAGRLYGHPGDGPAPLTILHKIDRPLGAVAPVRDRPGTWIAAVGDGIALLTPLRGPCWLGRPEARNDGRTRMNDGVCDPSGRFWAGSMAYDGKSPDGALYRVEPDGRIEQVLDGIVIANGPAFSPDGRTLFLADSAVGTITRYAVDDRGRLSAPTVILREESEASPDGMTVDRTGALWVAMWGGAQLRRYAPDGEPLGAVDLPATQPTSVALARGRAIVTTATLGLKTLGAADGLVLSVPLDDLAPDLTGEPAQCFR
jgi:sugar lactone lactonase YvrE